jgi:hypothetical protein
MQIASDSHLSFHSAGSRLEFPNPFADQDESTQDSFAATSQRSAQPRTNRPNSLASRRSQHSTPPTNPYIPSVPLGQLGSRRKRPVDPWSASTRDSKVSRGDSNTNNKPATTAQIPVDSIMTSALRKKDQIRAEKEAAADARLWDDDVTAADHLETPQATARSELPAHPSRVSDIGQGYQREQPRAESTRLDAKRTRLDSQYQEGVPISVPPISTCTAPRTEAPPWAGDLGAQGREWIKKKHLRVATGKKTAGRNRYVVEE